MTSESIEIAGLFPPADESGWRERVERALEGRPFESLISTTLEGLVIQPLYARIIAATPRALRQEPGPWKIAQRMDHPEVSAANEMALTDLQNGADALTLCIAQAPTARGFGLEIAGESDLDAALKGVELDLIGLRLDAGARTPDVARLLASIARKRRLASAALDVDFGHDPIGFFARTGRLVSTPEHVGRDAVATTRLLRDTGFSGYFLLADSRPYHEAGAGEAQELACALATGVEYFRLLEANGVALAQARDEIAFLLVADADEFLTLAKFRALRRLWARVEAACGLAPKPIRLHAETAFRMMTRHDPWMNICRATMAAFSAGLGGADAITVLPFTLALGLPDDFARRIARTTQSLLIEEAMLAKVADPAAGAGAFEVVTEQLCARAWTLFQGFEKAGGIIKSLEAGLPQREIAATAAARRQAIARGALPMTGTSQYPDLDEAPVRVLAPAPTSTREAPAPAAAGHAPLASHRDAEPFENLRAASDAALARSGARPRIFIANLGSSEACMAGFAFVKTLFEAGGILCSTNARFGTAEEAAAAFRLSCCKIAFIEASGANATPMTIATARALRAAGAKSICLAGRPGEMETVFREAGITQFIYAGGDVLAVLQTTLAMAV